MEVSGRNHTVNFGNISNVFSGSYVAHHPYKQHLIQGGRYIIDMTW